ncbi:MAG: NAD(P)(+) transhydrogenase (Re/Si-specific) subunit alpha, partial [Henriciella sp.]
MKLSILKETSPGETRVAATPDSVKKLVGLGHTVTIETGAGLVAGFPDKVFSDEGATIAKTAATALKGADVLLKVRGPSAAEAAKYPEGLTVIALMNPFAMGDVTDALNAKKLNALAMEFTPR